MPAEIEISKNKLYNLYVEKDLSSREIGKIFNCSKTCILNKLKKYGIKLKSFGHMTEARKRALNNLRKWIKDHPEEHRTHIELSVKARSQNIKNNPRKWKQIYKKIGRKNSQTQKGRKVSIATRKQISRKIQDLYDSGVEMGFQLQYGRKVERDEINSGHRKYGRHWRSIRKQIIWRDKICQVCGSKENLHVHHRIPYDKFEKISSANKKSNLILLCKNCHYNIHKQKGG